MLYLITQNDIRKDNPSIDAIPAFAKCNDRELKYIMLTYDYESTYVKIQIHDRKKRAAEAAGYKTEANRNILDKNARTAMNGGNPKVEAAIVAFKETQRDINREILKSYDSQIEQFIHKVSEPKEKNADWTLAIAINRALPSLLENRKVILDILNMRDGEGTEEEVELVRELSTLDKYNQKIIDGG